MSELSNNLIEVKARIEAALERSGRVKGSVTLIAVSKTKPLDMIEEMSELGQTEFGENYVQELLEKKTAFPDVNYHMIGHLQTNKVSKIVGHTPLIHSVDSQHLAEAISRDALKKGICQNILLQINGGNEQSKSGFTFENIRDALLNIAPLEGVHVKGLMCVVPETDDPEKNRPIFRKMSELAVDIGNENMDNIELDILSMGMTGDYEIAVEEGATMVRVGTALFGRRYYAR